MEDRWEDERQRNARTAPFGAKALGVNASRTLAKRGLGFFALALLDASSPMGSQSLADHHQEQLVAKGLPHLSGTKTNYSATGMMLV